MVKRIDFHIHTIADKEKDTDFEFSQTWLDKYVEETKLDAIAITNHNLFDGTQFNLISKNTDAVVFPGIELSLEDGHVNVVFDNTEENVVKLERINLKLQEMSLGLSKGLSTAEFKDVFGGIKTGILVFESGKSNSINIGTEFNDPFFDSFTKVLGVNNQWKFAKIKMSDIQYVPVLFSDAHASLNDTDDTRNNIKKIQFKHTLLQLSNINFQQIQRELQEKEHVSIIDDESNSELAQVVQVDVDGSAVKVSTGLNLIVGRRGSGKTFFLKEVDKQYTDGKKLVIGQFESAVQTEEYLNSQKSDKRTMARSKWSQQYLTQLQKIKDHYENPVSDNIESYLDELKTYANQANENSQANKIKVFKETRFEVENNKELSEVLQKLVTVIENNDFWEVVNDAFLKREFIETYRIAREKYIEKQTRSFIYSQVNEVLDSIKKTIEKHTGVSQPPQIKIQQIFRYKLETKCIESFMKQVIKKSVYGREHISSYVIKTTIDKWRSTTDFRDVNSAPRTGSVNNQLMKPYGNEEYDTFLKNLFSSDFSQTYEVASPSDLSKYLVNFSVSLETESGAVASGGQQVAFGLMMKLHQAQNEDIVLVDEPEASLDNVFIKNELVLALQELSKKTTVFVITHNSTLGTLLKPDRLIVTKYDENRDEYKLLSGDFNSHVLIDGNNKIINSYDDFVDAMEAGIDTYKEKGKEYENLKDK
ncbi:hypothetical protein MUDAN_IGPPGNFN_02066 [Lactiplantibacillus mudanjiangensis]|nr:hypothetical protein MUDAN_IGPPGNFN_02066 [Lactiplantibacillus mudanjiangensis]